ncbi:type IV pilin N-terminal domain-containing protein [Halorubellus sp. PRR65]|uniref:type IV pilin N-terminal domain-containing protein n=1 Tax=Halorubellus sp. PRR65 TaxID=3098148 RepID=UPI002B25C0A4|nr:type IV pilin N-terminal domain-containing protein [Halorubellus sp. PRR65]
MQLGTLLSDDDAVSPVVGVVLMVGITVTMAAVIGVFVLGASTTTSVPDAEFRYDAHQGGDDKWDGDASEQFVIEHDGGEDVELDRVEVQYAGTDVSSGTLSWVDSTPPSGDAWRPGEEWVLEDTGGGGDFGENEQVLVLWTTPDGSGSQILANGDLP